MREKALYNSVDKHVPKVVHRQSMTGAYKLLADVHRLRDVFDLDRATGGLTWKQRTSNRVYIGKLAGYSGSDGYLRVRVDGRSYFAHRVVFAITHGRWPKGDVDHINGDQTDNRPVNLREASRSQNNINRTAPSKSTSGVLGVVWDKSRSKWAARLKVHGVTINLGRYAELADAVAARKHAERRAFGEYARA